MGFIQQVSTQCIILMDIHVEDAEVEVDTEEEMVTIVEGVHLVRGEIGAAEEDLEDLLVVEEGDMDNRSVLIFLASCSLCHKNSSYFKFNIHHQL